MAKKKSKIKLKKDNLLILSLIIILIVLLIILFTLGKNVFKKTGGNVQEVKIVDSIDNFEYNLEENKTSYYKSVFNELKELLNSDNVGEEQYAKLITKLFVADFYDLNSKSSKSDIGGTQFILSDFQSQFEKKAKSKEGIYYYIKNNLEGNRKQELPKVKNVEIVSLKNSVFNFENIKDNNAYVVDASVTYEKDLGYQKNVTITLIHNNKKLEIVEIK